MYGSTPPPPGLNLLQEKITVLIFQAKKSTINLSAAYILLEYAR